MSVDPAIGHIVALGLALLFGVAALHKLADPVRFRAVLAAYRVLPNGASSLAVAFVIIAEALCAALLIFSSTRLLGATLAVALLSLYALSLEVNLRRGRTSIECGCVGAGARRGISRAMLMRNLVLASAAPLAAMTPNGRELGVTDGVTIACAIAAAAILYATIEQLSVNAARLLTGAKA